VYVVLGVMEVVGMGGYRLLESEVCRCGYGVVERYWVNGSERVNNVWCLF